MSQKENNRQDMNQGEKNDFDEIHFSLKNIAQQISIELEKGPRGQKRIENILIKKMIKGKYATPEQENKRRKNLRRRVADAITIMISAGFAVEDKKLIRKTFSATLGQQNSISSKKLAIQESNKIKSQQGVTLLNQHQNLCKLMARNSSNYKSDQLEKIQFPFLIFQTSLTNDEESLKLTRDQQTNRLTIQSRNPLNLMGDIDVLQNLFQTENANQNFQEQF